MNPSLFLELENAVNAVEPRVLKSYNPGLSDEEIDAISKNVLFDLPDDLRALYKWKNGSEGIGWGGFLGSSWWMTALAASDEESQWIREQFIDDWTSDQKALPPDFHELNFLYLFGDASGYSVFASCSPNEAHFQIYQMDKGSVNIELMFHGVEPMLRTALEWWESGVFHSPYEHQFGWRLETDFKSKDDIARRLNPDCDYWFN